MRTTLIGMLVALAGTLYVVESFVPFPVPFGRWGLSNSVVLFCAVNLGLRSTVVLASSKSFLGSIVTGTFLSPTFFMGFSGSMVAGLLEWILSKLGFGYLGLSLAGAAANNVVQVFIGSLMIGSRSIFGLLPIFLIMGSISAVVNAYIARGLERVWRDRNCV